MAPPYLPDRGVFYKCSCCVYQPLEKLLLCRDCKKLRCPVCVRPTSDVTFCPNCFDVLSIAQVRNQGARCQVCVQCPICGMVTTRRGHGDKIRLLCLLCKYSSQDAGYEDHAADETWDEPEPEPDPYFEAVRNHVRAINDIEEAEQLALEAKETNERRQSQSSARTPSRVPATDRFGLSKIFSRPKQPDAPVFTFCDEDELRDYDVRELTDEEVLATPSTTHRTYDQFVEDCTQVLNSTLPHVKLINNSADRCNECLQILQRLDYMPSSTGFRIRLIASNCVPEIRLHRADQLVKDKVCQFVLHFVNFSPAIFFVNFKAAPPDEVDNTATVELINKVASFKLETSSKSVTISDVLPPTDNVLLEESDCKVTKLISPPAIEVTFDCRIRAAVAANYASFILEYDMMCNPMDRFDLPRQKIPVRVNIGPSYTEKTLADAEALKARLAAMTELERQEFLKTLYPEDSDDDEEDEDSEYAVSSSEEEQEKPNGELPDESEA